MKDKLTIKEAAEYLGTSRQKIHKLIKDGKLQVEVNQFDTRHRLVLLSELNLIKEYAQYLPNKVKNGVANQTENKSSEN